MSYARFGADSDVYVFVRNNGSLCCCSCSRLAGDDFDASSTAAMLDHLAAHRAAGHLVPERTITGLMADADENDADALRGRR